MWHLGLRHRKPKQCRRSSVREQRVGSAPQRGSHRALSSATKRARDAVDAWVHDLERARRNAQLDLTVRETARTGLGAGDHAVLTLGTSEEFLHGQPPYAVRGGSDRKVKTVR